MATDLRDDATTEEIQEYVDQITSDESQPEEKVEEKSDSQKVAEDHDEVPAATVQDSEEDTTETATETATAEGEETGDSEGQDWLDDVLKAEVSAYGISEEDLADFTSRDELERALRLIDRGDREAGRKGKESKEAEPARDEKGQFSKDEPKEADYQTSLDPEKYDEDFYKDLTGEFARQRDHYESRIAAVEARLAEADQRAEEQEFDGFIDSLGHADLFGKSGKENSKQLQRRQDVLTEVRDIMTGRKVNGRQAEMGPLLVNRVARGMFAEDFSKKELKARTRKVSKQNSKILGGGSSKHPSPEESIKEWADRRYKELDGN